MYLCSLSNRKYLSLFPFLLMESHIPFNERKYAQANQTGNGPPKRSHKFKGRKEKKL